MRASRSRYLQLMANFVWPRRYRPLSWNLQLRTKAIAVANNVPRNVIAMLLLFIVAINFFYKRKSCLPPYAPSSLPSCCPAHIASHMLPFRFFPCVLCARCAAYLQGMKYTPPRFYLCFFLFLVTFICREDALSHRAGTTVSISSNMSQPKCGVLMRSLLFHSICRVLM